jgi:hypothetical protein
MKKEKNTEAGKMTQMVRVPALQEKGCEFKPQC